MKPEAPTHLTGAYCSSNAEQAARFVKDPEMILQLAHFLAAEHRRNSGNEPEVRALVLTSLNGRKPQLLIHPDINLANEPRGLHRREWIVALTEPLQNPAWTVPLVEWDRHVKLPPLPVVNASRRPPASIASHPSIDTPN